MLNIKDGKMTITGNKQTFIADATIFLRFWYEIMQSDFGIYEVGDADKLLVKLRKVAKEDFYKYNPDLRKHHIKKPTAVRTSSNSKVFLTEEEKEGKEVKKNVRRKKKSV